MDVGIVDERVVAVVAVAQVGQVVQLPLLLLFLDLVSRAAVLGLELPGDSFQLKQRKTCSFNQMNAKKLA